MTRRIPDSIQEKIALYKKNNLKYFADPSFIRCIEKAKNDFFPETEEKKCVELIAKEFSCMLGKEIAFLSACEVSGWDVCEEIDLHDIFYKCKEINKEQDESLDVYKFEHM